LPGIAQETSFVVLQQKQQLATTSGHYLLLIQ